MRLVTLKEIAALEPGEIVPAFRCQVKEVKQLKTGENQYGPWTLQTLTVMDATAVMQVKLFDVPEYTAQWVGAWIVVESSLNDKGKLSGIAVSTYRDKKEIHVKGKGGAVITQAMDAAPSSQPETAKMPPPQTQPAAQQQAPPPQQQAPPPVQAVVPEKQPAPKHNGPSSEDIRQSITAAKRRLGQAANGIILCYDAALYIANEVCKNYPELNAAYFSPDIMSKIAISLSIQLNRDLLITGLPAGPLEPWTKKAQQATDDDGGVR